MTRLDLLPAARSALPELDPRDAPALTLLGHDLRAALSEVMGGLRLVDTSALPATPRAQIARSRAACEALALLLEQTMTLLLGDAGPLDMAPATIRTTRLLDGLRLRWEGRSQSLGIDFSLRAGADLPPVLPFDPAMIERVTANLLGNAIKYAAGGHVACEIGLDAAGWLEIKVLDDGPGFPPALLPRLLRSAPCAEPGPMPGTGLGLCIVQDMVESAGGKIAIRNIVPTGAEVLVRLPIDSRGTYTDDSSAAPRLPDLSHLRILVADDSETSRMLASHLLGKMGADVITVADGVAAIGRIERESFDALLVDIEMPRFSGLDVIHYLRAMPGPLATLPVLAVTAYWLRANREAIEAAGANAVLSKPGLTAEMLGAAILTATKSQDTATPDRPSVDANKETQSSRISYLRDLAGPEVAADLFAQLLTDLQAAERGLLGAARGPNWQGIQTHTHTLIALAGTSGATDLQHLSEALNALAHEPVPDRGTYLTLLPQTLEALDALIHFIGTLSPEKSEGS